jgi:hypothetical protein
MLAYMIPLSMEAFNRITTTGCYGQSTIYKEHVEEIKKVFLAKFNHFIEEKKEEFHAENPDTTEDFHYHPRLR